MPILLKNQKVLLTESQNFILKSFQILVEAGLVPGVLLRNKYLEFICKNVFVKLDNKESVYFKNLNKEILELHIAHNDGNYFCSKDDLNFLQDNDLIAVKYCDINGEVSENSNPNGSIENIAGVFNKNKNILGMMPHPERVIDNCLSSNDGSYFFENLLSNMR